MNMFIVKQAALIFNLYGAILALNRGVHACGEISIMLLAFDLLAIFTTSGKAVSD
jgi:hypothetical protein